MNTSGAHRPSWAWSWGGVILLCAVICGWLLTHGARFDTRVTALLPDTHQSELVGRANHQLGAQFEDRFVLLLSADSLNDTAARLAGLLNQSPAVASLQWRPDDFESGDIVKALGPYRYRLMAPDWQDDVDAGQLENIEQQALKGLFMPDGLDQHPIRDPYGLLNHWLTYQLPSLFKTHHNLVTVTSEEGQEYAVLIGTLHGNPFDQGTQAQLDASLATFNDQFPRATLLRSGMIFHASEGARQARREMSTFGLSALMGLLIMLWLVFRSPKTMASLLLPLVTGGLFALTVTLLIFGRLHLLTIAFGTSLIGIAIDYAIHMQCARAAEQHHFSLSRLLPGLALGLASSVIAFAAQALTPLPGLRQMAIFAAAGLIGAWITVVVWLPRIRMKNTPHAARLADRLWAPFSRLQGRLRAPAALGLAALALILIVSRLGTDDSLRLLNTSSPDLLGDEQQVQRLLHRDTGTRYLLLTAQTADLWLDAADQLHPLLSSLKKEGHLGGFELLSDHVPTMVHQDDNLERTRTLYQQNLATLYTRAGLPETLVQQADRTLISPPYLTLDHWLATGPGKSDQRLWIGPADPTEPQGAVAGIISLTGKADASAIKALQAADRNDPHLRLVDRVADISSVLGQLRRQIAWWVGGALVLLGLGLSLRYRRRTWRVMAPAAGAVLLVLSLYSLLGVPLNLFHQLALLLVIGLGLDAGIFITEHPTAHHAWLAITLSTLSSLLAFGLLAFSATPVLHYIGLTTLLGLLSVWLLVPLVQPRQPTSPQGSITHE
ncbi:MMPL family transporter [Larsenimonas rhizosphaerae]|uniref:MMPL family transporter n=1 Tax=Larsenimonas rhizosphaerae TaxID=2944682 RepID=UPI00203432FC|nr:hypothetical protein [Larsenimonas rhizosphaerae]MCM2131732.1 hypothetical protein [Larsenimonas rhizosphaerae]